MTAVSPGSNEVFFRSSEAIVDHLLKKVLANKNKLVGTEVEMFFIDQSGRPITRDNGQGVFSEFFQLFQNMGYKVTPHDERMNGGLRKIVSLDIENLGTISVEAGHQFEFACSVVATSEEVRRRNEIALAAIKKVADKLGHTVVFAGHLPGYAAGTEGVFRSRGRQWLKFYDTAFGPEALTLREVQDGTASTQVTIDSGADKFHEYFKALLLLEPVLALHYNQSDRGAMIKRYGEFMEAQIAPVLQVWKAKTPRQALKVIVDRLLVNIEVPFLPDPKQPGIYQAEPLDPRTKRAPTVERLMKITSAHPQGRVTEMVLNNIGGFFYTWPAFRNYSKALLEVRSVDSQGRPEIIAEIAQFVMNIVYNDTVREKLLADYAFLTPSDIGALHKAALMPQKEHAIIIQIAGRPVASYMDDIINRGLNGNRKSLEHAIGTTPTDAGTDNGGGSGVMTATREVTKRLHHSQHNPVAPNYRQRITQHAGRPTVV